MSTVIGALGSSTKTCTGFPLATAWRYSSSVMESPVLSSTAP